MQVIIKNIRHGKGTRRFEIYASLYDLKGNILISATLDYILQAVKSRGYIIIDKFD